MNIIKTVVNIVKTVVNIVETVVNIIRTVVIMVSLVGEVLDEWISLPSLGDHPDKLKPQPAEIVCPTIFVFGNNQ